MQVMSNHTSTHLMNKALRKHVNPEADQKGSLVDDQKLRFDFSHGKSLTQEELEAVEAAVNADIAADLPVHAGVGAAGAGAEDQRVAGGVRREVSAPRPNREHRPDPRKIY